MNEPSGQPTTKFDPADLDFQTMVGESLIVRLKTGGKGIIGNINTRHQIDVDYSATGDLSLVLRPHLISDLPNIFKNGIALSTDNADSRRHILYILKQPRMLNLLIENGLAKEIIGLLECAEPDRNNFKEMMTSIAPQLFLPLADQTNITEAVNRLSGTIPQDYLNEMLGVFADKIYAERPEGINEFTDAILEMPAARYTKAAPDVFTRDSNEAFIKKFTPAHIFAELVDGRAHQASNDLYKLAELVPNHVLNGLVVRTATMLIRSQGYGIDPKQVDIWTEGADRAVKRAEAIFQNSPNRPRFKKAANEGTGSPSLVEMIRGRFLPGVDLSKFGL